MWGNLRNFRKRKRADQKVLHENHPRPRRAQGQFTQEFDGNAYQAKIAVRCTVFPDLTTPLCRTATRRWALKS